MNEYVETLETVQEVLDESDDLEYESVDTEGGYRDKLVYIRSRDRPSQSDRMAMTNLVQRHGFRLAWDREYEMVLFAACNE